uniref:Uncharacterized protein n=1 Tax=Lactuca sativa TaxID=4236 RepID=A0A9R1XM36_LACSA|nr:hypothetical protein LSAT_V11C200066930 [Lactuca sativa]
MFLKNRLSTVIRMMLLDSIFSDEFVLFQIEPWLKSNPFSLSDSGFLGAISRSINLGDHLHLHIHPISFVSSLKTKFTMFSSLTVGQTALALRLLLATFSSKISSNINRPFGDEFHAARKASKEIRAQVEIKKYGKEVPLGIMLKILKAKGAKERKDVVQNESTPAAHQL